VTDLPSQSDTLSFLRASRLTAFVAGVIALAGGIVLLFWPDQTVKVVAVLLGIVFVIIGLGQILDGFSGRTAGSQWGWVLLKGLIDLAFGIVLIAWPGPTVWVIVLIFGIELIVSGIASVVVSMRIPKEYETRSRWLWRGIIGIVAGLVVLAWPDATVWVVVVVAGIYLIVVGLVLLWAGFQLGRAEREAPAA
jgi:uncharacterized membrane protein HdeD (DUF308 family)